MLSTKTRAIIAALAALAVLAFPVSALALEPLQWMDDHLANPSNQPVGNSPATPWRYESEYTLTSEFKQVGPEKRQELIYGNETFGIDLNWLTPDWPEEHGEWAATVGKQWEFIRQPVPHESDGVPATERVALYDRARGSYLARGNETFGIDLVWSSTPQYQWQVAEGISPTAGQYRTELYNTSEHGYLIEHVRELAPGVDLSWDHRSFEIPYGYKPPGPLVPHPAPVQGVTTAA